MKDMFVTDDGGTLWLEHFPDGATSEDACEESPICEVQAGLSLAQMLAKAEAHTC